jgi:hypothetical protein
MHVSDLKPTPSQRTSRSVAVMPVSAIETWAAGWLALVLWVMFVAVGPMGLDHLVPRSSLVTWVCLSIGAAHFVCSYPLAYGRSAREGGLVRAHRVALVWTPAALAVAVVAIAVVAVSIGPGATQPMIGLGITGVLIMTTWHGVKQVYGVGRLGAGFAGIGLDTRTVGVLRFGLYPLWFSAVVTLLVSNGRGSMDGYFAGVTMLPTWAAPAARGVAVCSMIAVAWVLTTVCVRAGRVPGLLVAPYAAWALWLLAPPAAAPLAILPALHGLQYLVCVHRAERASHEAVTGSVNGRTWWPQHVLSAAAIGVLVLTWIPQALDRILGLNTAALPGVMVAAAFVVLNTHHYLIDAVVWRSDGHHVRSILNTTSTTPNPPHPRP